MLNEATQEFTAVQGHASVFVSVRVILPAEHNALIRDREQAVVTNCNAVRVAAQVSKHLRRTAECRFGVNNPLLTVERTDESAKLTRIAKRGQRSGKP